MDNGPYSGMQAIIIRPAKSFPFETNVSHYCDSTIQTTYFCNFSDTRFSIAFLPRIPRDLVSTGASKGCKITKNMIPPEPLARDDFALLLFA